VVIPAVEMALPVAGSVVEVVAGLVVEISEYLRRATKKCISRAFT
jgi:hypothetical protein